MISSSRRTKCFLFLSLKTETEKRESLFSLINCTLITEDPKKMQSSESTQNHFSVKKEIDKQNFLGKQTDCFPGDKTNEAAFGGVCGRLNWISKM